MRMCTLTCMYMYVCVRAHTCGTPTCMRACVARACVCACACVCVCAGICVCAPMFVYAYVSVCMCVRVRVCRLSM